MDDTLELSVKLMCFFREEAGQWVAGCPSLDVYSQGDTPEDAQEALREAVGMWIESCLERDTLEQAMREVGWHRIPPGATPPPGAEFIGVKLQPPGEVLGQSFPLEIKIPAYQAAALLSAAH